MLPRNSDSSAADTVTTGGVLFNNTGKDDFMVYI